jgi:hypothetical protein
LERSSDEPGTTNGHQGTPIDSKSIISLTE